MTRFRVGMGVTTGGPGAGEGTLTATAWVFDLPGCRTIGGSVEESRSLLPVAIAEYLAWRDGRADGPFEFDVVEELRRNDEFCFEDDKRPLSDEDLNQGIQGLEVAFEGFSRLVQPLPDLVLDWKPPATSVRIDAIYSDVRTIREMAEHVAAAMTFHIRGVGRAVERVPPPADPKDLRQAYEVAAERLRRLDAEERSGKAYRRETPRGEAEWSARKAIRRMINHMRFHTGEAANRLTWPTLGVPVVLQGPRE